MDDGDLKILHEARLLTPGEFDAELHSRNLGTCMVVERPFPSRALDALSIYPKYLEDLNQKLTSSVERGLQQEITERARFSVNRIWISMSKGRKGKMILINSK